MALAFKTRRPGLDRLRPGPVPFDRTGVDPVRGADARPAQLELFGFPPPGHPIWTEALLDETALRYPKLDLSPWRGGLVA